MKEEIRIFFTALMFYTRIPCPSTIDHSPDYINKATRYFPLIGWIVGLISFLVLGLAILLFDVSIAIVFSLMAGVLTTGAFHEDGLADVFDGFGGGWTKPKILEIMKDSRIGTFGVIALIFVFLLKFFSLQAILTSSAEDSWGLICLTFITYHALSRLTAINLVFTSTYAREDEASKAKPLAKNYTYKEIFGAYLFGILPLVGLCFYAVKFLVLLVPLFGVYFFSKRYFEKWIGGYTGDCLGAVEQMAECVCLLSLVIVWKFM